MVGQEYLIMGDTTGKTFKFTDAVYTDDGQPVAMRVKTKYFGFNSSNQYSSTDRGSTKLLEMVQVFGSYPNGVLVSISKKDVDGTGDYEVIQQIIENNETVDYYDKGNTFSIGFDSYSASPVEIEGIKFHYKDTKEIL